MFKVEALQDDVNKIKTNLDPLIDDSRKQVIKLNSVFEKIDNNLDVLKGTVDKIRDTVDSVMAFEQKIQSKIESPVLDTVNAYVAIVKGLKVFFEKMSEKRTKPLLSRHRSVKDTSPKESFEEDEMIFDDEIQEEFNDINKELNEVRKKLEEMKRV